MTGDTILHIGKQALETALLLSAPALIVATAVGFLTAMLQAVTSIRDQTLGLVLKLAFVGITLMICGSWMMQLAVRYTEGVFNQMQAIAP
jgi:flagellar biosynthetic protein FliQ